MLTTCCQSKHCLSTNFVTPIKSTHHPLPSHCPLCARPTLTRDTDMPDYLSYTYIGVKRAVAIKLLAKLANYNVGRPSTHQLALTDFIERHGTYLIEYPPSAYSPLTVICNDCASCYRVLRGQPNTLSSTPPKYCIWCGSRNITICTVTDEAAAWEVLSSKYQLPIPLLVKIYNVWQSHGYYQHFHDFITSPHNSDTIETLQLAYNATATPKTTVEVS